MDGEHTLKDIVLEDYNLTGRLSFGRAAGLVSNLRQNRLLTSPPRDVYAELGNRLRGSSFTSLRDRMMHGLVSVEFGGPYFDGLFGRIYENGGRIFFTRTAAIIGLVLGVCGPVFLAFELARHRYPLFQTADSFVLGLLLFIGLEAVTLAIHELGHALAAKHAGRFVPRAGVMLYYGFPAAFVDTSDIWMADRRNRLLTSFAGTWTGLVLGGMAGAVGYFLPDSGLGAFLHAWSFVLVLNTLLNLNPLLELDGYYLLIDLLDRPMLRARSLAFVRETAWRRLVHRERLRGDEPLLLAFGVASVIGSAAVLVLAFFIWRARTWPAVVELWDEGNPFLRGLLIAIALAIALIVATWLQAAVVAIVGASRRALAELSRAGHRRRNIEAAEALRNTPLLANAPEGRLLDLASLARWREVLTGAEAVREGEPGDAFYVIERGEFEVTVAGEHATVLGPGDYFGERALLDGAPRAATVTAAVPGRLLALSKTDFDRTLRHDIAMRQRVDAAASFRERLRSMPLFAGLSSAGLDLLLTRLQRRSVEEGEAVIREGEPGQEFAIVLDGSFVVTRQSVEVGRLGSGDVFGETALILDIPRTATVTATAPGELLVLDRQGFETLLLAYLDRADDLQRLSHLRLESQRRVDEVGGATMSQAPTAAV